MQEYVVLYSYKPRPTWSILLRSGDKLTSEGGYLPRDVLIRVVGADGKILKNIAPVFLDRYTAEIRAGEPEIEVKSGQELQIVIGKWHHEDLSGEYAISFLCTRVGYVQYWS
ncbi:MAG: hypothetical protein KAV87_59070 [Desulfobacteraceae bacterium]|nr:hypothetical protein [Desulfobacteraceae bacterium]